MKKSKKQDWFNLAQILAILSGTLIVGTGLFANMLATSYSSIQTNVGLIYQAKEVEPNAEQYLLEANNELKNYTRLSYNLIKYFLVVDGLFLIGSLIAWFIGYKSK